MTYLTPEAVVRDNNEQVLVFEKIQRKHIAHPTDPIVKALHNRQKKLVKEMAAATSVALREMFFESTENTL